MGFEQGFNAEAITEADVAKQQVDGRVACQVGFGFGGAVAMRYDFGFDVAIAQQSFQAIGGG